jgi:hypothetical protein
MSIEERRAALIERLQTLGRRGHRLEQRTVNAVNRVRSSGPGDPGLVCSERDFTPLEHMMYEGARIITDRYGRQSE